MTKASNAYSRQSFLGPNSELIFRETTAAIVGLGGGGSHIAQQLGHIGVGTFVLIDPDSIELSNLNRTVGARRWDVLLRRRKARIARRLIRSINPAARVVARCVRWQHALEWLRGVDIIFGCLDGLQERSQLEAFARRYVIPYVDIGMDIHKLQPGYALSGQVIVSLPGGACMRCMRFLTDARLAAEGGPGNYGDAGGRPQVVWPNGVLASVAVGAFVQLFTPWHPGTQTSNYIEYEGNGQTVSVSNLLLGVDLASCPHYWVTDVGDPWWTPRVALWKRRWH